MSNNENQQTRKLDYFYAQILVSTRKCVNVLTSTGEKVNSSLFEYVQLDSLDLSYKNKYYINGAWYEDAEGTVPWSPTT